MQLTTALPDWVPPWVVFAVLVIGGFLLLALLLMPFSVFGLKGRLDAVEARLDEIQGEIRSLVLRLPEPGRTEYEPDAEPPRRWAESPRRPPIPPMAPRLPSGDRPAPPANRRVDQTRASRAEPRFDPN